MMGKPLDGIRVFDITLAGVGPWATKLLGELGADVIHVESPDRGAANFMESPQLLYVTANNNKRSALLDLKDIKQREAVYRLLRTCDVFVENMRPGVMSRLGLDYETVSKINPGIVYLSASGYGQTGHMVPRPGADPQLQAFSGWTSVTGVEDGEPEFLRVYIHLDYNTSQYITQAILMALYARGRTGRGQKVEVAMLAAAMSLQSTRIAEYFATGKTPPRLGNAASTTAPHEAFRCEDKRYLAVGVVQESQWRPFCEAIDTPELTDDPRFTTNEDRVTHRRELSALLQPIFERHPLRYWEIQLTRGGVPNGRFLYWDDLRFHPQVIENGAMSIVQHPQFGPLYQDGAPWQFSKSDRIELTPTPLPDQHTQELLAEFGTEAAEAVTAGEQR